MARRIIDCHQHVMDKPEGNDELAEVYDRLGVVKAVLLGFADRRRPGVNDRVMAAARRYPTLFVPFVGLDLDKDSPDDLARYRDEGFVGIKCISPDRRYNHPSYFPLYEKAAELRMPVLFHLGIIGRSPASSKVDSSLMRPIHLDHIARSVPELRIIGAHFGNPWSDEAAMACRWNPNLFFDLSGSLLKYRSPEYLGGLLWWKSTGPYASPDKTNAWQKIVFGSDVAAKDVADVISDYERVMDRLELDEATRDQIWYGTGARILGIEQEP